SWLGWLTCGPALGVFNSITGQRLSYHHFGDAATVGLVMELITDGLWGLLIQLSLQDGKLLCFYNLSTSRVVRAIRIPKQITCIEVIGSVKNELQEPHCLYPDLQFFNGIVAIGTDQGELLFLDLALQKEGSISTEQEPAGKEWLKEIKHFLPKHLKLETSFIQHMCLNLQKQPGKEITLLLYIGQTNQLVTSNSMGIIEFWNLQYLHKEFQLQLQPEILQVYALNFQKASCNDSYHCYLWVTSCAPNGEGTALQISLVEMTFHDYAVSTDLYQGFRSCQICHTQRLCSGVESSLRVTHCLFVNCQIVESCERMPQPRGRREFSNLNSLAVFVWKVKDAEQSCFLAVFNINQWLQEGRPTALRSNAELKNCCYLNIWSLGSEKNATFTQSILDVAVHGHILWKPAQTDILTQNDKFDSGTGLFDLPCFTSSGIKIPTPVYFTASLIIFSCLKGPVLKKFIRKKAVGCVVYCMLPPGLAHINSDCYCTEDPLKCLLMRTIRNNNLIKSRFIRKSTLEADSAVYCCLDSHKKWLLKVTLEAKEALTALCFSSCKSSWIYLDQRTIQAVFCLQRLLKNAATVIDGLKKQLDLMKQSDAVVWENEYKSIKKHILCAHVVQWCWHFGILQEAIDQYKPNAIAHMWLTMQQYYKHRRVQCSCDAVEKIWGNNGLIIDEILSLLGEQYSSIGEGDDDNDWEYPFPSLQAVLKLYLLDLQETRLIHFIFLYFLQDVTYFIQTEKNTLKLFSSAFCLPFGFCQLIKCFWLLDHKQTLAAIDLLLSPNTWKPWLSWQHTWIIKALLSENKIQAAFRYVRCIKPEITNPKDISLYINVLLLNRCVIEAWNMLIGSVNGGIADGLVEHFFQRCQEIGLLSEL
uniref:Uncharacterized protein n=1 Tax=Latimeria chalumnae TaxID=7897 RepID=H3AF83_LATCH